MLDLANIPDYSQDSPSNTKSYSNTASWKSLEKAGLEDLELRKTTGVKDPSATVVNLKQQDNTKSLSRLSDSSRKRIADTGGSASNLKEKKCECYLERKDSPPSSELQDGTTFLPIGISDKQLERIQQDLKLADVIDVNKIKAERERKKEESNKRKDEFKALDEKFGRAKKNDALDLSLAGEINKAKGAFYNERAAILKLRECEDFQEMNSFVYKAKSQAIRDNQRRVKEIKQRDADKLLAEEINQRYVNMKADLKKERQKLAEKAYWNNIHLQSLIAQIKEKDIEKELTRLKYQEAALIRKNHTAYRLKKRLEEIKKKEKSNAVVRKLQRGVYENRYQLEAIQKVEDAILEQREKKFFEEKSNLMAKFKTDKEEKMKQKGEHFEKLFFEEKRRQEKQKLDEEIAYIRGRDLVDKKWRMEAEEKEKNRLEFRKKLWEEQQKTKEDILDHMCVSNERDRLDFNRIVRENQEDFDHEQEVEREKRKKKDALRQDLLCTIYENIGRKREEWKRTWQNAQNQVINNILYKKYHDREMFKELNRLRNEGLEEKYIIETMRHCNITPDQKVKSNL